MTGAAADSSFGKPPEWIAAWVAGGFGRESGALERTLIQSTPDLLRWVKRVGKKTISGGTLIASPGLIVRPPGPPGAWVIDRVTAWGLASPGAVDSNDPFMAALRLCRRGKVGEDRPGPPPTLKLREG